MGFAVTNVKLSIWIISIRFLLVLFLALDKRRDDVLIFQNTGHRMRKSIDGYNLEFVNAAMVIMAAVVIFFYAIYTVSIEVIKITLGQVNFLRKLLRLLIERHHYFLLTN